MAAVTRIARAKVNLALHVTGVRRDGYHVIETLVVFCDIGDSISVSRASRDGFEIKGRYGGHLSITDDNLVVRARERLRAAAQREGQSVFPTSIVLHKELPISAGIGGGSADAAAVLHALAALWRLRGINIEEDALALGADVPMCLMSQPLVASGVGENLQRLNSFPSLDLVLVNPGVPVSTFDVFAALENKRNPPLDLPPTISTTSDLVAALSATRNDLEEPARQIAPEISSVLKALRSNGARLARMSGSGATCFGIFSDADSARDAVTRLRAAHPQWYVETTRTLAGDDQPMTDTSP